MTDIKLQEYTSLEGVTMDFLLKPNGTLDTSEELATAVRVALGTDRLADANEILPDPDSTDRRGWWADYQAEDIWDGWPVGTKNWLLMRAKITDAISEEGDTVERARIYTLEALQPFIDKGICSRIDVDAQRTDIERIEVHVTIYRGPKAEIDLRYQLLWEDEPEPVAPTHRVVDIPKQSSSKGLQLSTTAPTVRTRWPQALKRDLVLSRTTPFVARGRIITPARRDAALSPTAPTRSRGRLIFLPQANRVLDTKLPTVTNTSRFTFRNPAQNNLVLTTSPPVIEGDIATGSDVAPAATLYMGLEDGTINTYPGTPSVSWNSSTSVFDASGLLLKVPATTTTYLAKSPPNSFFDPRRGTMEFWMRINSGGGSAETIRFYDEASYPLLFSAINLTLAPDPGNGAITFHDFKIGPFFYVDKEVSSGNFTTAVGEWVHIVWTWQGRRHCFYRNGVLNRKVICTSALPQITWQNRFVIGNANGFTNDLTMRRIGIYNYAFNAADAAQAYAKSTPSPVTPTGTRGFNVDGTWGAGEGKLHVSVDTGIAYSTRGNKYRVTVQRQVPTPTTPPPQLLLHMNGANGSTTFIDSSGKTVTAAGNAQISTAQSKFGGSSGAFDGAGDGLFVPNSTDFNFPVGTAFTIDGWFKFNSINTYTLIDGRGQGSDGNYAGGGLNNAGDLRWSGVGGSSQTAAGTIADANWHHIAFVRQTDNIVRIYVDGVNKNSGTITADTGAYTVGSGANGLGLFFNPSNTGASINGYVQEFRILKGTAVWTANFTPPALPYTLPVENLTVQTFTGLVNGFAEQVIDLGGPIGATGTYTALVELLDSSNVVLSRKYVDSLYIQPNSWIGQNIGISNAVQSPWSAISVSGTVLSVWGRDYTLTGAWGLPQQITSQGQNLFNSAPSLTFNTGSGPFSLTTTSLNIDSTAPHLVTWTGNANANGITGQIKGSLDYTGLVTIDLTIQPTTSAVNLTACTLKTSILAARAKHYAVVGDKSYWDQTKRQAVPTATGTFVDGSSIEHVATQLYASIVLSDDDRGIEWSADNMAGWYTDSNNLGDNVQTLVKESDGSVSLNCNFVTLSFSLAAPRTIRFYYIATPVKSLPSLWRQHHNGDVNDAVATCIKWTWPDDGLRSGVWRAFSYEPEDYPTFTSRMASTTFFRPPGRMVSYVDMSYLAHSGLDNAGTELDMVYPESNPAFTGGTLPTQGTNDYCVYHYGRVINNGHMDGLYMDDPFTTAGLTANLLSGGYTRPDGSRGYGFNFPKIADRLKRLKQVMLDKGLTEPVIWLHTTGNMNVRAWRFATHVSDGESFKFDSPTDPDWIDVWGNPSGSGLPWLFSIGRAKKFGFVPTFLDYISFYSDPAYVPAQRAMRAQQQILDIQPVSKGSPSDWSTYQNAKATFGLLDSHTFNGYWTQTEITTGNSSVVCSYYNDTSGHRILAYIANLGSTSYTGTITFNKAALGLTTTVSALNRETGAAITVTGTNNQFALTLAKHDYIAVQIG